MIEIITVKDDARLVHAMEANLAAFWMDYGQAPTGEAYTDSHVGRFASAMRHPLFNGVFGGYFATDETADCEQTVRETIAYFRARQRSAMWWVGPSAQSPTLIEAIKRGGWHHIGDVPGMLLDLHQFDDRIACIDGLTLERVENETSLHQWVGILGPANDISAALMKSLYDIEVTRGFANENYVRYLARFNEQSVAASAVYYHAGVAGIFAVATDAKWRGRGFGRAVTVTPLIDAKRLGYTFSVLQASELGYPVYQHLGYEHRWMINLFALQ